MIGVNWERSSALRHRVLGGTVCVALVISLVAAVLSLSQPAAAAPDGTWDWNASTDPADYAQAGQFSSVSTDGRVIATLVDASAIGESGTGSAIWHIRISRDGGETWSSTSMLPGQIPNRMSVSPTGDRIGLSGAWYNSASPWLYLSGDSGASFNLAGGTLPTGSLPTSLVVRDNVIYTALLSGHDIGGGVYSYSANVYASIDNGTTWSLRSSVDSVSPYLTQPSVSANGQRVVLGSSNGGLLVSNDGASTWTTISLSSIDPELASAGLSGLSYSIAISEDGQRLNVSLYAYDNTGLFTEAALYTSTDAGATWQKHEDRLAVSITGSSSTSLDGRTILALDMSNYDGGTGIGTMTWVVTRNGGTTWEPLDTYSAYTGNFNLTLSGDGRTIFLSDNNGDAGALRLIAGRWTPVPVIDDGEDDDADTPVIDDPTLGAPDTGSASGGLSTTPALMGGIGILLITGLWLVARPGKAAQPARRRVLASARGEKRK